MSIYIYMKIRIIIDYNNPKLYEQYNQMRNIIPNHIVYIYKKGNTTIEENVDYNIFMDIVSENVLNICPTKYNILIVNEEYVLHKYVRRESYKDEPLILIKDVINYYFCLTLYSQNILIKNKIHKNEIKYFNNFTSDIYLNNSNNSKKYILYDVDLYSEQDNVIMLQTWMKYFIDRPEYLVITYKYHTDSIVRFNYELLKNGYFKNIILRNISIEIANNYTNMIDSSIYASIINISYYNTTTILYSNILKERIIITTKNDISNEFKQDMILMNSFNELELKNALDKLFKCKIDTINNKQILIKSINKTKKKINTFFKNKDVPDLIPLLILKKNNEEFKQTFNSLIIKSHNEIKNKMLKIDKKYNKPFKDSQKYYRLLKEPDITQKTEYAYASMIILNNNYLSSILTTGYRMKYINKTKYNLICFVQDMPYYEDDILKFPGLSQDEINSISLFYDCIIGIDLLKINTDKILSLEYSNDKYYSTKLLCYSFTYYSKILYYDASTLIQNNIDYYFIKYNENKYYNNNNNNLERGLVGNLYLFLPKTNYLNKILYLIKNYSKLFEKQYHFFKSDEDLLYYTIYPHWSKEQIDYNEFQQNYLIRYPYIKTIYKKELIYNFNLYVIIKPFIYNDTNTNITFNVNSTFFNANHTCYKLWDLTVKDIIIKYPHLYKYFEFIITYRYTLFD
jgi:hypothetical protein